MAETTLLAVRHGETAWNREGRLQGWAPVGLTDRGRDQALTLGADLATRDVDRVVASDLVRTRETVALFREAGVTPEPTFDGRWRERGVGVYQGLLAADLFERHPEFSTDAGVLALRARPEGGESILDLRERVLAAVDDLRGTGETVLVVTHGGPLSVLRAAATGTDLLTVVEEYSPENCSVLALHLDREGRNGAGLAVQSDG